MDKTKNITAPKSNLAARKLQEKTRREKWIKAYNALPPSRKKIVAELINRLADKTTARASR